MPVAVAPMQGGLEVVEAIAAEWRALCAEGPCNEPFYRPEWIAAYLRAFEPDAEVLVLTARRDGRLRGVLPLVEETLGVSGVGLTRLRGPANVHSNRLDLIHGGGDAEDVVAAIWRSLADRPGWDVLEVRDVPEKGAFQRLLARAARDGYSSAMRETLHSPYIPLPEQGEAEAVFDSLSRGFRRKLQRGMRKLAAHGPVRLSRYEEVSQATLARFYELERAGWKGNAGTAIACDPATHMFYTDVAMAAARHGYLALYELWCGDQPVAIDLGMMLNRRYFEPKVAYNDVFRSCGPGHLMMHEIIRDLGTRDVTEFDLLGHSEPYKLRWTPAIRRHYHCHVFNRGLSGRAFQTWSERFMPLGRRVRRQILRLRHEADGVSRPRGTTRKQRP